MTTLVPSPTPLVGEHVNWRRVWRYLGFVFGLAWLIDGLAWGLDLHAPAMLEALTRLQMLLPGLAAILLTTGIGRTSRQRWFCGLYVSLVAVYALAVAAAALWPLHAALWTRIGAGLAVVGLAGAIGLSWWPRQHGDAHPPWLLRWGAWRHWLAFGGGYLLILALLAGGNWAFHLGQPVFTASALGLAPRSLWLGIAQDVFGGAFLGLFLAFGHESGWRGYLQGELLRLGAVKGVLLVGLLWAAWRWPAELLAPAVSNPPIMGALLYFLWAILMAYVLGYILLKTGSLWLVALVSGVHTQGLRFITSYIYQPTSTLFSFTGGLYGLLFYMFLVMLLLLDPIWREDEGELHREAD